MRKRLLYGSGVVLLAILLTLVVWQVSFNFGEYGPADLSQTFIFWAVSTLVFVLTITLGFILFRTGVKLYIERRSHREGSRIQSKLFFGALALSIMPVCFLVAFSYAVMNRNLEKWFTKPAEAMRLNYGRIAQSLKGQLTQTLEARAALLAERSETQQLIAGRGDAGSVGAFALEHGLLAAQVANAARTPVASYGALAELDQPRPRTIVVERTVKAGDRVAGYVRLAAQAPFDVSETLSQLDGYVRTVAELTAGYKYWRLFYIEMQILIALFTLFVTTWIALFLAKQISAPISALLRAQDEVGEGNLSYRVEVKAIDELAGLVRGFNEMTSQLEANSRELDARRRFTEAILESIPTGVISLGSDGSIQRVNRALKNIFPEDLVARARRLEDLFARDDTAELRYLMKRARRTGSATREMELKTERQTLQLSVTVSALEEKLTSGYVLVLEDLSELLRAQKAAAWREVARRVAHEIKNPLTPIALSAERIARQIDRATVPADVHRIVTDCAATIMTEVESVKTLVDEFAQFARFPSAQPARCDLNDLVESALGVFAGRLDGIGMVTSLMPGLPPVLVDREQFKRVVVNLVDNAAEAMQESFVKELTIQTRGGADAVELIIADTGCGVSPDEKEKLFLPYFSTKGRGTGLGLAIVNHVLSEHGASIRVEDNLPTGARFTIEIPAVVELGEERPAEVVASP